MNKPIAAPTIFFLLSAFLHGPLVFSADAQAVPDEIVFTGLVAWAKHCSGAYWAIFPDADCETEYDPSPPGKNWCTDRTQAARFKHEPFLLFHNVTFVGNSPAGVTKQGIHVNVDNTPCTVSNCDHLVTNLKGVSLKGSTIDFDLSPTTLQSTLATLVSSDDIPKLGWKLELADAVWTTDPAAHSADYVQTIIKVDSGKLKSSTGLSLDCKEKYRKCKKYGLVTHTSPCNNSVARSYAEDVFLEHEFGNIKFSLNGTTHEIMRTDSSKPMKIYVMNIHPPNWHIPIRMRPCIPHHKAFRWFYTLAKTPPHTPYEDHFYTCDLECGTGANRRCPQALFD